METPNAPPQQQGCSLTSMLSCLCIPLGGWFGFHWGWRWKGWLGALIGVPVGAIAGVFATLLLVAVLVSVFYFGEKLTGRLSGNKGE